MKHPYSTFSVLLFACIVAFFLRPQKSEEISKQNTTEKITPQNQTAQIHNNFIKATSSPRPPKKITTEQLDHSALLKEAKKLEKNKRTYRFAQAIPVALTTQNSGEWSQEGNREIWNLNIHSPGASSLNLGFKSYRMPEGGELSIHPPNTESPYRSFTHDDNEEHGELWTPLLQGDEMEITLSLPIGTRNELALEIGSINHGFRSVLSASFLKNSIEKIGGNTSSFCNIDAVCLSNDPNINETLGPILDLYQDQIRSVAAYTVNGIETCSGALINNTANDKKPYFLTANHCFFDDSGNLARSPASAVFFFNFQNSYCRAPNTAGSAGVGDGITTQFSSGSILRATSATSDFCLLELDDLIPDNYDVFYAGWNRNNTQPNMAVGIHHPAVAEKRISVDTDRLSRNNGFLIINDWDYGTTEPGSSGSPLFDSNGHIVGQLYGGSAACGNDLEDLYGPISVSWTGNNSTTRLRDWLDPSGSGSRNLDGISQSPALMVTDAEVLEGDSGSRDMIFTVRLSESSSTAVTVNYQTSNGSAIAGNDYNTSSGTLTFPAGETDQQITISVSGDTVAEGNETFSLTLSNSSGAIIRTSQATGNILTDDFTTPVLSGSTNINAVQNSTFNYQLNAPNTPANFSLAGDFPPGMTINPETGLVAWIPPTTGTFSYTVRAINEAGSDSLTVNVNVASGTNTMSAIELEDQGIEFHTEGRPWFHQTSVTRDNVDALQSGNINDSESSAYSITVNGPGTVSFRLRVSTEENFDFVYFVLNGDIMLAQSGNVDWTLHSYDLKPGLNTLSWLYIKDFIISENSDTAWLDEVSFTGYSAWAASNSIATYGQFIADADGDGAANGLEYATGLSPLTNDIHLLPTPALDSNQRLRLTFSKPNNISGITYDAQVSDDLIEWGVTGRSILANGNRNFDARENTSNPAATKKFMRLQVYPTP